MRDGRSGTLKLKLAALSFLSLSAAVFAQPAAAKARHAAAAHNHSHKITLAAAHGSATHYYAGAHAHRIIMRRGRRGHGGGHVIQCVAYAKSASDVVLHGNARDWWHNAAGVYERGSAPEEGSVLNFRGVRRMPLGHVAVVRNVINSRTIIIDQSHWAQNGISHNTPVIDVSPNNDWSAVRVALNNKSGTYGSIYPTYGFIYGRRPGSAPAPKNDVMLAWAKKLNKNGTETQLASAPANAEPVDGLAGSKATFSESRD
ncbi:CHAP domain-containing protein [Acetobacter orientalis]|uniref:CHAP domain-containing protein n=1 Tax=Acetobacter orientalis TaxID=146474 RepID=UPI00241CD988|nr:CHAP domain-containing protein [Acetobacter orientalis]